MNKKSPDDTTVECADILFNVARAVLKFPPWILLLRFTEASVLGEDHPVTALTYDNIGMKIPKKIDEKLPMQ